MIKTKISISLIMCLLILFFLTSVALAKGSVRVIDGNKAQKGKLAPRFIIETIDGEDWSLRDFKGEKAIVITFWATWCEPCIKELPYVQKFYEKYSDSVEILAISEDAKNHKKVLENKVKELGLTFPVAMDSSKKLAKKIYRHRMIPYLVVIGKDGKILKLQQGSIHPEKLIGELEELFGDTIKPNVKTSVDTAEGEITSEDINE